MFASRRIADIFFGDAARLEEWFEYGGEPNFFRVTLENLSPPWERLLNFLEISEYFKRLSQELEKIRIEMIQEPPEIYTGAGVLTNRTEWLEVLPDTMAIFVGMAILQHRTEWVEVQR